MESTHFVEPIASTVIDLGLKAALLIAFTGSGDSPVDLPPPGLVLPAVERHLGCGGPVTARGFARTRPALGPSPNPPLRPSLVPAHRADLGFLTPSSPITAGPLGGNGPWPAYTYSAWPLR